MNPTGAISTGTSQDRPCSPLPSTEPPLTVPPLKVPTGRPERVTAHLAAIASDSQVGPTQPQPLFRFRTATVRRPGTPSYSIPPTCGTCKGWGTVTGPGGKGLVSCPTCSPRAAQLTADPGTVPGRHAPGQMAGNQYKCSGCKQWGTNRNSCDFCFKPRPVT